MLSVAFILFLALLCPQLQTHAQDATLEQVLQRSKQAEDSVRIAIEEKLPANSAAREAGADVLATLQRGLKLCDDALLTTKIVPDYVMCVGTAKGLALASLGEVAGQEWAKSGASRPGLFC